MRSFVPLSPSLFSHLRNGGKKMLGLTYSKSPKVGEDVQSISRPGEILISVIK